MNPLFNRQRDTLADVLAARARAAPETLGFRFLGRRGEADAITYGDLDRRSRRIARRLARRVQPGERVLLVLPPGLDYIAAFFGCIYAGALATPVYTPRSARDFERLFAIAADSGAGIALANDGAINRLARASRDQPTPDSPHWLSIEEALTGPDDWTPASRQAGDPAFLQYTSGSTASPKGVVVTHGNLIHNLEAIRRGFRHDAGSRGVIWLPPYHDMGLIGGILQPLYASFPVTLMSPLRFIQNPARWLRAVSEFRGSTSGGPNFAYDLCLSKIDIQEMADVDLSSWTVAFNGGEPINPGTLAAFSKKFAPLGFRAQAFYPCYGLAEATLMVTGRGFADFAAAPRPGPKPSAGAHPAVVSVGPAMPDMRVRIVDPKTGRRQKDGEEGEIWAAGPSVAAGYWDRDRETRDTFAARIEGESADERYLRTGDLGFLKDGQLHVTGRVKDLIIIRGVNIYPHDVEQAVALCDPALRPHCGAAISVRLDGREELVVIQEIERRGDPAQAAERIRAQLADSFGVRPRDIVLIPPNGTPKTSSGKVRRHECKKLYLQGAFQQSPRSYDREPQPAAPAG